MIDISVTSNFSRDSFEKEIINDISCDIKQKLQRAGVAGIKVTISGSIDELNLNLNGSDDQLEKAKKALDLD